MNRFIQAAVDAIERSAEPKKDRWEIFLRTFSRSPDRQQIQEYLRELRSAAFVDQEDAVNKGNSTAAAYYSGHVRAFEELLIWLSKYDPYAAEE